MSRDLKGCFSHKSDDWRTPSLLYNAFIGKGFIDCFPFHSDKDELNNQYQNKKLFINPPYSKMSSVSPWIMEQALNDNKVALLVPARTDTEWFQDLLYLQPVIIFIKGRLHFNDSIDSAPFPSVLLLFNYQFILSRYCCYPYVDLVDIVKECL